MMLVLPVLMLAAVWVVTAGAGSRLLDALRIVPETVWERGVYGSAFGLGVLAYLVFALGMAGLLSLAPVLISLVLLAVFALTALRRPGFSLRLTLPDFKHQTLTTRLCFAALLLLSLVSLLNCFVPPGAHEWDVLSYHLAAPKLYLLQHRIHFLPTQHQSNFPFLTQMLFTVGLLFDGYALANLFHWTTGVLCLAGIVCIGRRHFSETAGWVGAVVFAAAPVVVWEAGIAYIDVAQAFYVLVAVGAALEFRTRREPRWLALSGILMGFALGVKTLSLIPAALVGGMLLWEGAKFKNLRWYLLGMLVFGCPFYIRTWVWTNNPVYPFAYRLFPDSRYWNQQLADTYATEHTGFGQNRALLTTIAQDTRGERPPYEPPSLVEKVRNLVLAPFGLLSLPRIFYNANDADVRSHLGFLFLALPPGLLLFGKARAKRGEWSAAAWVGLLTVLWFAIWSVSMQYVRYLIPLLPFAGLLGGEAVARLTRLDPRLRFLQWLAGGVIALQVALTLAYFVRQLPEQTKLATDTAAQETYKERSVNIYAAQQWINQNTPKDAGVILFEDTRGYYLDRPYLWGNRPHSLYIPYPTFANGQEMVNWFVAHDYRYALVNLRFYPFDPADPRWAGRLNRSLYDLLPEMYRPDMQDGEFWRKLLGSALDTGAATVIPDASRRNVVVLEFHAR